MIICMEDKNVTRKHDIYFTLNELYALLSQPNSTHLRLGVKRWLVHMNTTPHFTNIVKAPICSA